LFNEKYAHRDFPPFSTTTTGSNNCDLDWGKPYDVTYNVSLERPITTGATISADLKASIIPLKFDCPACGGNCSVKIPIVGKTINIALPPCPINPNALKGSKSITLPAKSPIPLKLDVKGSITVKNGDGTVLADVTVDVALDPNAEEEEQDTYYYGTLRKYVWGVNDGNGALTCFMFVFFFLS
jgi:hypothetical protein